MPLEHKKHEDFAEWYLEAVQKSKLMDYAPTQGCMVFRPDSYFVWEQIQHYLDPLFRTDGVKNAYFPIFIPESFLKQEALHFEGFIPEVAWVTQGGNQELGERLALRPTSEAIMYHFFAKWISSHRDLPLKLNQWTNVIRWDTKTLKPFLRTREFLWQEGHTAHASSEEAGEQVLRALDWYAQCSQDLLAIPVLQGFKSDAEKFPGAFYSTTIEAVMPDGKALQMGTSHHLGQNFAKMFGVRFKTEEKEDFAWQTSWGVSTRMIGAAIMVHGDDKGLVWPPKIAPTQVAIVPIFYNEEEKKMTLLASERIKNSLSRLNLRIEVDDSAKSPGFKFNESELRGIPIRIEIGLRDLAKVGVTIARRDSGEKEFVPEEKIAEYVEFLVADIQQKLFLKAKLFLESHTTAVANMGEFKSVLEERKGFVVAEWCGDARCEEAIKEETTASIRLIPFNAQAKGNCVYCGKQAKTTGYFAKAY
ncbi:MAG: proline--tRNA ligase [Candidatus Norongarragalinales archaeon]